jgi:hypothetical protein
MYFAHDFVHMLFRNPLRPRDFTFGAFCEMLNVNEWVASNETEVLTYYRIPGMREQSLPYTILYDLLVASGYKGRPTVAKLLELRKDIIYRKNNSVINILEGLPEAKEVFAYLRKYKENNEAWCQGWYSKFPELPTHYEHEPSSLSVLEYDSFLEHYRPDGWYNQQLIYEQNIIRNVRNLVMLCGPGIVTLPTNMNEVQNALAALEGKIVMRDTAQHFHETYVKNKTVGTGAVKK